MSAIPTPPSSFVVEYIDEHDRRRVTIASGPMVNTISQAATKVENEFGPKSKRRIIKVSEAGYQ